MKKKNRKGFTIVELVIVIAVIGILAAVLIPTFSNVISDANASKLLQETRNKYTEYLIAHPGAEYDNVKNGETIYDINNDFVIINSANGTVLTIGTCPAPTGDDNSKCEACGWSK